MKNKIMLLSIIIFLIASTSMGYSFTLYEVYDFNKEDNIKHQIISGGWLNYGNNDYMEDEKGNIICPKCYTSLEESFDEYENKQGTWSERVYICHKCGFVKIIKENGREYPINQIDPEELIPKCGFGEKR